MKTQTTAKVVGVIFLIILGAYLANYFGIFQKLNELTLVSLNNCPINTICKESNSPYQCPPYATGGCKVKCDMECINPTNQPLINFRTNALNGNFDSTGVWIAWDVNNDGSLECFSIHDNPDPLCNLNTINSINLPNSMGGYKFYGDTSSIWIKKTEVNYNYCAKDGFRFLAGSGCEISNIPTQPFTDRGQELTEGGMSDIYRCNGYFETYRKVNNVETIIEKDYTPSFLYSSTIPGTKSTVKTFNLNANEYAKCSSDLGTIHLMYDEFKIETSCTPGADSICVSNNAYQNCVNGIADPTSTTNCDVDSGEVCDSYTGKCALPFTKKEIILSDEYGVEKSGFTREESIYVKTKLVSSVINSGIVKILVYRYQELSPIQTLVLDNYNFNLEQTVSTKITNPLEGRYYVRVFVTSNEKTFQVGEDKEFRISIPIECTLYLKSSTGSSKILAGVPAYLELNAFATGAKPELEKITFISTFRNNVFIINSEGYEGNPIESTRDDGSQVVTYKYPLIFDTSGTFDVSGIVEMNGVQSKACTITNRLIESLSIKTTLHIGSCVPYGETREILFEVKNNYGEYVDATNTLKVTEPGSVQEVDIDDSIEKISTGQYKFSYTFNKKGGYKFYLVSTSPEYSLSSSPITGTPESNENCQISECSSNQYCIEKYDENYICSGGICVTGNNSNLVLYLIIGLSILIVIVIIFIIIVYSRRKNSPNIGIGGM